MVQVVKLLLLWDLQTMLKTHLSPKKKKKNLNLDLFNLVAFLVRWKMSLDHMVMISPIFDILWLWLEDTLGMKLFCMLLPVQNLPCASIF